MLTESDKKFKQDWENTMKKGRTYYGLVHGGTFGLVIFVLVNLFSLKDQSMMDVFWNFNALRQFLTMVLGGMVGYGTIKWWLNQRIYKKILEKE